MCVTSKMFSPVWKSNYGAFVLNCRVDPHAIDATPARWRGDAGSSPLDGASTAASSPRNDLVHPTHSLISTQVASSIFRNNNAEDESGIQNSGKGSAVTVTEGVLDVRDSIFDSNEQHKQGAIYTWDTLNISLTNCSFTDNEATDGRGGAVCFEADRSTMDRTSLQIQDCTFRGNEAKDEGGALYTLRIRNVNISNCLFEENDSTNEHGGGAYVQRPQDDADGNDLTVGSRLDVRDTTFRANKAKESGGGLYAIQISNVTISNCLFESNDAEKDRGGGFYVLPYVQHAFSDVRVRNTVVRSNTAAKNGGGAFVNSAMRTTITDCLFDENTATDGHGGGAYVQRSADNTPSRLDVLDSVFRKNNAGSDNHGGGLYALQVSKVDVARCTFEENKADAKGGGLYAQPHLDQTSSDVRVRITIFRSNEAKTNGGGAFVGSAVTTTFSDVEFLENSADGNAGAANMGEHAGTALFERVLVSGNTAGLDSGGIHLYRTSGVFRNSTFTENTAGNYGGALGQDAQDSNKKELSIDNSTFISNEADAGGAVTFKQDTTTIHGCTFTGNTAKAGSNNYNGRGGALYKGNGARLDLTDSMFSANHAEERGGAIYATGSTGNPTQGAYVGGCSFQENIADAGGAALGSWLESWGLNASSFVDNDDTSDDEGLMRLQKGHIWVRDCEFTTAQRILDLTTTDSTLKVYCSPTLTSAHVFKCGGCDATYDDDACGPVVDANAFGFDVTWP